MCLEEGCSQNLIHLSATSPPLQRKSSKHMRAVRSAREQRSEAAQCPERTAVTQSLGAWQIAMGVQLTSCKVPGNGFSAMPHSSGPCMVFDSYVITIGVRLKIMFNPALPSLYRAIHLSVMKPPNLSLEHVQLRTGDRIDRRKTTSPPIGHLL